MNSLKAPSLNSLLSTDRGSSDSLLESLNLDLDDIDDILYSIPPAELPSLDAVMNEIDSDLDSITSSVLADKTNYTPTPSLDLRQQSGSILRHVVFHGVTTQIGSAADRTEAGYASAVAISKLIAVGTSHGFILTFDNTQTLRWCCLEGQQKQQGAVSSLSFNSDDSRLLAGFSRGTIIMINTVNGDVLRSLTDVIAPNSGVLTVKWTSRSTLALCLDSGGSVWSLSFTRKMGIRGCDSRCLFSGSRGEVCAIEPLLINDELHPLHQNYSLVALATLSKFFILMIRPRLKVIKYHMLHGPPDSLPLLSWQMVLIQSSVSRSIDPVLATARGNSLFFHQLTYNNGRITVLHLRHIQLSYNLMALHWLGPKNIACIERNTEIVHLLDVRTNHELETKDISNFGVVYSSAQFKGIATGGNVSPALALAGTFACYSSVASNDENCTLYILGRRSLHGINARNWSDRLSYLTARQNWAEAFELAVAGYKTSNERPRRQGISKDRILQMFDDYLNATTRCTEMCLENVIKCLIEINQTDLLWQELWDRLYSQDLYLNIITQHILDDNLKMISTTISQALVNYWMNISLDKLETVILKLDWQCLDLHQALTVSKSQGLYKALMHLNTKALNDYAISLVELIPLINDDTEIMKDQARTLGNNILVYISSCLAGRGYPTGDIEPEAIPTVKHDILHILTVPHSINSKDNELQYPYLRALLRFDTRETLNVLSLAFQEREFNSDLGLSQRQRIINILLEIIGAERDEWPQQFGILCNFMSLQITTKNLPDSSMFLQNIIEYITEELPEGGIKSSREHLEREQTFLNLLEANTLSTRFTYQELLAIARRTQCYLVARNILEKLKIYDQILECYILGRNSQELIGYILEHKNTDERKIYQQMLTHFQLLIDIECDKVTKIIIEYYPICVPHLVRLISDNTKLLYQFLECLIANGTLPLECADYNTYLRLLCEFNQDNVLEYLENTNHNYDVNYALSVVQEHNLTLSLIYLYEKKSEYRTAFNLAIELLKEAPESLAESYALQASSLCVRASNKLNESERELFWFELISLILSQNCLSSVVKNVLHTASSYVNLTKLVQLIMTDNNKANSKSFGDIKYILIGMLTNFEYESLLLTTTANVLSRDLNKTMIKEKQAASVGIYCRSLKCVLCKKKLSDSIVTTHVESDKAEQIIVFSTCGHSMHNECFQKQNETKKLAGEDDNGQSMKCEHCGSIIRESDSYYLNKTNRDLFPVDGEMTTALRLLAPTRKGLTIDRK